MSDQHYPSNPSGRSLSRPPSIAEITEFAKKTKVLNLDVSIGTLMEHLGSVEPRDPSAVASGWGIVNDGYGIVTSGAAKQSVGGER
jgi:hypothetical protein